MFSVIFGNVRSKEITEKNGLSSKGETSLRKVLEVKENNKLYTNNNFETLKLFSNGHVFILH